MVMCRLIRKLISVYATSMNIELQQRSIEFGALFRSQEQIRSAIEQVECWHKLAYQSTVEVIFMLDAFSFVNRKRTRWAET